MASCCWPVRHFISNAQFYGVTHNPKYGSNPIAPDLLAMANALWPVRKKMSHSLFEEISDAASKKDASHECWPLRH